MILSRGRSYLFIHIPKTGGTSMALALEARAMKDDIMLGDTPKARRRRRRLAGVQAAGRLWKHATIADLDGLVAAEELPRLFCFTMVRNPWDRVVSYYHWLRAQRFDHPSVRLARAAPFERFLEDAGTQASLARWPAGRYMRAADGTERVDAWIRLEHLSRDLAPLEAHLGFALALPHANRSDREAGYRAAYTPALRDIVARCCREDIERFGYDF